MGNVDQSLLLSMVRKVFGLLVVCLLVFQLIGCDTKKSLDQDPDKIEKRRQEYKKQQQRELDEG